MNLKEFLASRDGKNGEFYWSLVIEKDWIQAGIWQIINGRAQVISVSPPAAWETEEELVGAVDTTLSAAIQNFPEDVIEPTKTVFGLPNNWVSEGQIKKENLEEIRKVCAELSLEPAGFVVLPEAIAHYYKTQEGSPLNAIVLGVGNEELELTIFKLGNLVGTTAIARSVSIADDVIEGLTRFSLGENLPSRILLYNGKEGELEDARQSLINAPWEENEKIKFLHTPKIEIINPDSKVLAVSLAGASEIGEASQVTVLGREIKEEEEEISQDTENIGRVEEEVSAQELGFVIGQDVAQGKKVQEVELKRELPPISQEKITFQPFFKKLVFPRFFPKIKTGLGSLFFKFKKTSPETMGETIRPSKKVWLIAGIIFTLLLISGFSYWWFFPKATVTIYVSPQRLIEEISLIVDTEAGQSNFAENILAGEEIQTEVSGEKTKSTTGTKKVGERAKGTVKIQNGTAGNIILEAGTILVSPGDLRFTLDKTASVSAALSPSNPGTTTAEVTAADIGAEYNLVKDESFKVGNYPKADVDAISLVDFSGGSSRDVAAVSEKDREDLEKELTEELIEKAKEEIGKTIQTDKFFINGSLISGISQRLFNHKVGDESETLKLSLTISVKGALISKKELFEFAKEKLKDKVASGYILREEQVDVTFRMIGSKEGRFEFAGNFLVNLLPEIKTEEIAKKIAGRYPKVAENYLATIPGYTRAEIRIKPKLVGRLSTLPRITKNITIEITSEK